MRDTTPHPDDSHKARSERRRLDRAIFALAIPALGSLVVEPLFIAVDSAMVGHLGTASLAGLSVASAVLQTAVGLMVFLAYATTPLVARRLGTGDLRGAVQAGVDGLYLAVGLGVLAAALLWWIHPWAVSLFPISGEAVTAAHTYLLVSLAGLPAMLAVFAATGLLRGLQDTRTPLWVAGCGFAGNAALNALLIYGFGLGIAGSALGTVIAQYVMVAVYLLVIHGKVRDSGASWRPRPAGIRTVGGTGGWLFVRTLSLRASLLLTLAAAAAHSTGATAVFHVVITLFSVLAFGLDALAIAAQSLIGKTLGEHKPDTARAIVRRCLWWGVIASAVFAVPIAVTAPWLGRLFLSDHRLVAVIAPAVWLLAASLPLSGVVFVLDGVLMGSGDARYLAFASIVNFVVYLPCVLWVQATAADHSDTVHALLLTGVMCVVLMLARLATLGARLIGSAWMHLPATPERA